MRLRHYVVPLTVLACALRVLTASAPVSAEKRSLPTLVVIGASKAFDDKGWEDARVGFGIRQLIGETLFDTDRFALVEEKEDVRKHIDDFAKAVWALGGDVDIARFAAQADSVAADRVAWGIVESFSVPQSKLAVGPFHRAKQTTVVKIRVHIKNTRTGKVIDEVGEGKSRRTVKSAMFSFRDKTKGGKINFDKTAVGHATREAIKSAVKTLKKKGWLD